MQQISFYAVETISGKFITAYDDLSVTQRWAVDGSHYMTAPIVRGQAYTTMTYAGLTPQIQSVNTITSINGSAPTTVSGTKFKIVYSDGHTLAALCH
ncbi:MAG: hypothetical protein WDN27_00920 [Candidatus Saccharibacteria bacterium]